MTYIPKAVRREVADRAQNHCEYCLLDQRDALYKHEVDHIIPEKHRGQTVLDNLCLACLECNRYKGSNFGSFAPETGQVALLFNPRRQIWREHFRLNAARIIPLSPEGRVTVFILNVNDELRVQERWALIRAGTYPPVEA